MLKNGTLEQKIYARMKNRFILLFLLLSGSLFALEPKLLFETNAQFIENFFDSDSKHRDQTITWWVVQMILLAKKEGNTAIYPLFKKLGEACVVKSAEAKSKRAPRIAEIFLEYKSFFSQELHAQIRKIGFQKVLSILKKRTEKLSL